MTRLVSLDPGATHTGWAVWEAEELQACGSAAPEDVPRLVAAQLGGEAPNVLAVERQDFTRGGVIRDQGAVAWKLGWVAGRLCALLAPQLPPRLVAVRDWRATAAALGPVMDARPRPRHGAGVELVRRGVVRWQACGHEQAYRDLRDLQTLAACATCAPTVTDAWKAWAVDAVQARWPGALRVQIEGARARARNAHPHPSTLAGVADAAEAVLVGWHLVAGWLEERRDLRI